MNTSNLDIVNQRLIDRKEFNYLDEIKEQTQLFLGFAGYVFANYFENYDNFKYVDIAEPDAYEKIYAYVEEFINSHKEN